MAFGKVQVATPEETRRAYAAQQSAGPQFSAQQSEAEKARKAKLRQMAVGAGYEQADVTGGLATTLEGLGGKALGAFDQQTQAGQQQISAGQAQALAAGQGAGGSLGGGGMYGALLQGGKQAGMAQASFGADQARQRAAFEMGTAEKVGGLRAEGAGMRQKAAEYDMEAGSSVTDDATALREADAEEQKWMAQFSHWYGDDENGLATKLEELANIEPNEKKAAALRQKAAKYREGANIPG